MTGFNLTWFIQDSNGTRLTVKLPGIPVQWNPKVPSPIYRESDLKEMVMMACKARGNGMTRDDIITSVIAEKSRLLQTGIIPFKSCSEGHLQKSDYSSVFSRVVMDFEVEDLKEDDGIEVFTHQDMETGFMMFS